jgi:preprotein translocase subunit SecF
MFKIIGKSKLWISIATVGMVVAMFLFFPNMNFSIQFTGGMEFKVDIENNISNDQIETTLEHSLLQANL